MIIDAISNGIVIDHISAGRAMDLYNILGLDKLDCTVALLKNVVSSKLGRKDIIKIDRILDLDWDVIGYVDPGITVNIIKDGQRVEKRQLKLPERITVCEVGLRDCALRGPWATRETAMCCGRERTRTSCWTFPPGRGAIPP